MFNHLGQTLEIVRKGFLGCKILVVGDLMLDRYISGEVRRISPEAPVPVVRVQSQCETLGGATNVALNLVHLGAEVSVAGVLGLDEAGDRVESLLKQAGIRRNILIRSMGRPTTTKMRVIGGHQQMLRLDTEDTSPIEPALLDPLWVQIEAELPHCGAVILSDYAKGLLAPQLCQAIIQAAGQRNIPVFVDPKGSDYRKYSGATAISPNLAELSAVTGVSSAEIETLLAAGSELIDTLQLRFLIVTRSEQGMTLLCKSQQIHLPTMAREVFDVSGAGDTVIATLTAAYACNLELVDALRLSNLAAGIVVGKLGTVPIERTELLSALETKTSSRMTSKICELSLATQQLAAWRGRGERIVFTNGCFDLLHAGHVDYLQQARNLGERLIVGLNTDISVRRLKGPQRPINHQQDRARVLAALTAVDMVILFEDDTPLCLILALRPDILVKGTDYAEHEVVGAPEVKSWGGEVALIELLPGRSTTRMISKIATRETEPMSANGMTHE